ncbi:MAG: hypothetical protein GYA43_00080 [Bacteroidales bacterium]|nr:hypothetical protein [Bacteroidales bacterium]
MAFSVLFLAFDKIFILVANRSADAEADKRLELLLNGEINKDLIIAGSSRGSRDIIASRIEEITGLSSYNLCYPGSNVEFHEFVLRTLLEFNKPPEIVLLVVDDDIEFLPNEKAIFRLDRLYPLVKYSYIRQELIDRGEKDRYLSRVFVLHNLNKANFDLREKKFSSLDTIMHCGSMPVSFQRKDKSWDFDPAERDYPLTLEEVSKVKAFKKILTYCSNNDIRLVILFPPNYKNFSKSFERRIRDLAGNKTFFYKYDCDNPVYTNKDFYYDQEHLISEGAFLFTEELTRYLTDSLLVTGKNYQ